MTKIALPYVNPYEDRADHHFSGRILFDELVAGGWFEYFPQHVLDLMDMILDQDVGAFVNVFKAAYIGEPTRIRIGLPAFRDADHAALRSVLVLSGCVEISYEHGVARTYELRFHTLDRNVVVR